MIAALRKRFTNENRIQLTGDDEIPTHVNNGPPQPTDGQNLWGIYLTASMNNLYTANYSP